MILVFFADNSVEGNLGRFFLVVYNTSQTVSASYATFIVLAISFGLAAVFGALYYGLATGFSGNCSLQHHSKLGWVPLLLGTF